MRESGSFHSSIQSHLKGHSMAAKEKTRVPVRLELLQPALLQIPYDRSHNRRVSTAQALFKPFSCLPRYFLASPAQRDVGETFVWTEAPKMGVSVLCNQVAMPGQGSRDFANWQKITAFSACTISTGRVSDQSIWNIPACYFNANLFVKTSQQGFQELMRPKNKDGSLSSVFSAESSSNSWK